MRKSEKVSNVSRSKKENRYTSEFGASENKTERSNS